MPRAACPQCGSTRISREHYRGWSLLKPLNPFRTYICNECQHRFTTLRRSSHLLRAWRGVADSVKLWRSAVCPRCSSADVRRTEARGVRGGWGTSLARLAMLPAYRCNRCRNQYFALARKPGS